MRGRGGERREGVSPRIAFSAVYQFFIFFIFFLEEGGNIYPRDNFYESNIWYDGTDVFDFR